MKKTLPPSIIDSSQSRNVVSQKGFFNFLLFSEKKHTKQAYKEKSWMQDFLIQFIVGILVGVVLLYIPQKTNKQVEGVTTTPTPVLNPTPINLCNSSSFISDEWNLSHYHKDADDFYLPNETTKKTFWFPPITYKNKISGTFKKINVVYEDTYQSEESTQSATFLIALYDDNNNEILEIDAPEPNRQLIGFKKLGNFSDDSKPIIPILLDPFVLRKQIAYTGTNTISVEATSYKEDSHTVTYHVTGNFTDHEGNPELMYKDIMIQLPTSDSTLKLFKFIIGTGIGARLKIKNVTICEN